MFHNADLECEQVRVNDCQWKCQNEGSRNRRDDPDREWRVMRKKTIRPKRTETSDGTYLSKSAFTYGTVQVEMVKVDFTVKIDWFYAATANCTHC